MIGAFGLPDCDVEGDEDAAADDAETVGRVAGRANGEVDGA